MRFLIADRQPSARSALRLLLEQYPDMEYAGETGDFDGLLKLSQGTEPGLLLMEWEILGCWPKGKLSAIKATCPMTVVVLSCCLDRAVALNAGADYYVSKGDKPEHLIGVLEDIRSHSVADPRRSR